MILEALDLEQDNGISSDGEEAAAEAISHTSKQGQQQHKKTYKKRRQAATSSDTSPAAKKPKVEPMFRPAEGADGKLLCLFVNGECIPLWPQYVDKAGACNFIRATSSEDWVNKFMVASRKATKDDMAQANEKDATGKDKKKWTKHFVKCVCDEVLREFKTAMVAARAKLPKSRSGETVKGEPDNLLGIKMRGGDVIASTNARQLYIQATEKSVQWIQNGLRTSVKAFLDQELRAMSHTSSGAADDYVSAMLNMRNGVRDKIRWMPETCKWSVHYSGDIGKNQAYCKEHRVNLGVSPELEGEDFLNAREQAFLDALKVWNAIDESGRKRIVIPARRLNVPMVTVPYSEAMSHTDSDRDDEQSDGDADQSTQAECMTGD